MIQPMRSFVLSAHHLLPDKRRLAETDQRRVRFAGKVVEGFVQCPPVAVQQLRCRLVLHLRVDVSRSATTTTTFTRDALARSVEGRREDHRTHHARHVELVPARAEIPAPTETRRSGEHPGNEVRDSRIGEAQLARGRLVRVRVEWGALVACYEVGMGFCYDGGVARGVDLEDDVDSALRGCVYQQDSRAWKSKWKRMIVVERGRTDDGARPSEKEGCLDGSDALVEGRTLHPPRQHIAQSSAPRLRCTSGAGCTPPEQQVRDMPPSQAATSLNR
jgi:hypothetical protein